MLLNLGKPIKVMKCSACSKPTLEYAISKHNFPSSSGWTDGKLDLPIPAYMKGLQMAMCPHCHALIWLDELEVLAELPPSDGWLGYMLGMDDLRWLAAAPPWDDPDSVYKGAKEYEEPSFDDYLVFSESEKGNQKKEKYTRIHALWAGNDERRILIYQEKKKGMKALQTKEYDRQTTRLMFDAYLKESYGDKHTPLSAGEIANLQALVPMLDESVSGEFILKAEVLRELGQFDDALRVLAKYNDKHGGRKDDILESVIETQAEMGNRYVHETHLLRFELD